MVAGALAAPTVGRRLGFGKMIALGPILSVLAAGLLAATVWTPSASLTFAAFFVFGAGPILWTIGQTTLRQAVTPGAMLGRVSALFMMMSAGARPVGALLGGFVGERYGLGAAVLLSGAGFVLQAAVLLLSAVPRLQRLPEQAAEPA